MKYIIHSFILVMKVRPSHLNKRIHAEEFYHLMWCSYDLNFLGDFSEGYPLLVLILIIHFLILLFVLSAFVIGDFRSGYAPYW